MALVLLIFTIMLVHHIKAFGAENRAWAPIRFQRSVHLAVNEICFIIQVCGGIDLGVAQLHSLAELGSKLKIAAFVTQMVFCSYILAENIWITVRLGIAIKKAEKAMLEPVSMRGTTSSALFSANQRFSHYKRWSQLFGFLISVISFGRDLIRFTELGVAFSQNNEWTSYAFDIYQMMVVMGALAVWYLPGKVNNVAGSRARYRHLGPESLKSTLEGRPVERDNEVFSTDGVKPRTSRLGYEQVPDKDYKKPGAKEKMHEFDEAARICPVQSQDVRGRAQDFSILNQGFTYVHDPVSALEDCKTEKRRSSV